jgi:pimeloyl-ACP methyl ester carboxylesterase
MTTSEPVTLNFVERGTGVPVLSLHGWVPDHRLMLGCLEPLFTGRPGYRRLYPDLPGMGASPAPASISSTNDILQTVDDFVQTEIGSEPFLLVGESFGGYLARALTRRRAGQVLGLALICPIGTALERADRRLPPHTVLRPDPEVLAGLEPRIAKEFADLAVVQSPETARRFREEILVGLDAADTEALARIRRNSWRLSEGPEGDEPFARPTLILTGRQDEFVGYLDQFELLAHYPRASFAVLDIAGHNLQIEQPHLFNTLMLEWLDRVEAES